MLSGLKQKFIPSSDSPTEAVPPSYPPDKVVEAGNVTETGPDEGNKSPGQDMPNENAQDGVTQAEAITLTWTKASLSAAYIM